MRPGLNVKSINSAIVTNRPEKLTQVTSAFEQYGIQYNIFPYESLYRDLAKKLKNQLKQYNLFVFDSQPELITFNKINFDYLIKHWSSDKNAAFWVHLHDESFSKVEKLMKRFGLYESLLCRNFSENELEFFLGSVFLRKNRFSKMQKNVEILSKAIAEEEKLMAIVAHELRNPIAAIMGMSYLGLQDAEDNKVEQEILENIHQASTSLENLLSGLLNLSLGAKRIQLNRVPANIGQIVSSVLSSLKPNADLKRLSLTNIQDETTLEKEFILDPVRFSQVVYNFVSNAIKYTPSGFVEVNQSYDEKSEIFTLKFSDSGIGMAEEETKKLFRYLSRTETSKDSKIEGFGIGLAISKTILDSMDAKIEVNSIKGQGTTFVLAIPLKVAELKEVAPLSENNFQVYPKLNLSVLVVDDSDLNLSIVKKLIESTGCHVDIAISSDLGLTLFKNNHYDVVVFDHNIDDRTGVELLHEVQKVKDDSQPLYKICLTADEKMLERQSNTLDSEFDKYLLKPIAPSLIQEIFSKFIECNKNTVDKVI